MNLAHIDELDAIEMPDGFVWRPVRKHFGIRAFGTNAYTPGANGRVIEEHTERILLHEEIYLVLRGRVRFTVGDEEHELGQGQLVFLRDPTIKPRRGCPHRRRGRARDRGQARRTARDLGVGVHVRRFPRPPRGPLRRGEATAARRAGGETGQPRDPLRPRVRRSARRRDRQRAPAAGRSPSPRTSDFRDYAQKDEDFASIRDDPRFSSL